MIGQVRPIASVLELDQFSWRPALPSDALALESLAAQGTNRALFALPKTEHDFMLEIGRPGFRLPFICSHGHETVGVAATTLRNQRSLNVQLICFFKEPSASSLPLAIYVRHIFWTLPLHRVYVQIPLITGAHEYIDLLKRVGFIDEGVVRSHALIDGETYDVAALGLLREEFEAWCHKNESRLAI